MLWQYDEENEDVWQTAFIHVHMKVILIKTTDGMDAPIEVEKNALQYSEYLNLVLR